MKTTEEKLILLQDKNLLLTDEVHKLKCELKVERDRLVILNKEVMNLTNKLKPKFSLKKIKKWFNF